MLEKLSVGCCSGNIIQSLGGVETPEATQKMLNSIMLVKGLWEEVTVDSMKELFTDASDIIIPQHQKPGKRCDFFSLLSNCLKQNKVDSDNPDCHDCSDF